MSLDVNRNAAIEAGTQVAMTMVGEVVQHTENTLPGPDQGDAKRKMALGALSAVVTGGEAVVASANPAYAGAIGLLDAMIRGIIKARKAAGKPVQPVTSTPATNAPGPVSAK